MIQEFFFKNLFVFKCELCDILLTSSFPSSSSFTDYMFLFHLHLYIFFTPVCLNVFTTGDSQSLFNHHGQHLLITKMVVHRLLFDFHWMVHVFFFISINFLKIRLSQKFSNNIRLYLLYAYFVLFYVYFYSNAITYFNAHMLIFLFNLSA